MRFIDFLEECGFSYWQTLPFVPVDECNSPYKSFSTFAGNPYFVDLPTLFDEGLLSAQELAEAKQKTPYSCEYDRLKTERVPLLMKASTRVDPVLREEIDRFVKENKDINDFCVFMAKKDANGNTEWQEWTTEKYDEKAYFGWCFIQFEFYKQWAKIKEYANNKGIKIIGDIPIYVSLDSSDVYNNRELFLMDDNNRLTDVAGVPPDYFSADGQLWGNPLYDWKAMEKEDFLWWRRRIKTAFMLFDGVRIDHFRGIESFWAVPGTAKTAKEGKWVKGPGMKLVKALKEEAGKNMIIAEDLGDITPEVAALVEKSGFPGMRVFQFGFLGGDSLHRPHHYINNCIAYSGTHDNNTLLGYLWETPTKDKIDVMNYCGCKPDLWNENGCDAIVRTIMTSAAGLSVFPIQDLLGYGNDTRLNVPGRAEGNWMYRITEEQLGLIDVNKYRYLNEISGRV